MSGAGARMLLILGTVALGFGALVSLYTAHGWGEMAGIQPGGDKSGLGGLAFLLFFQALRWLALAVALGAAVWAGGFAALTPARGHQALLVLGLHAALGLASYAAFNWIANGITRDQMGPQRLAWVFAVVLPLPAFLAAAWGLWQGWLLRHPRLAVVLAVGVLLLHLLPFRSMMLDMRRSAERLKARRAAEATPAPTPDSASD